MRFQAIKSLAKIVVCAAIALTSCAGGSTASLGLFPHVSSNAMGGVQRHAQRFSIPTCSGKGSSAFVGGDDSNVAGGAVSAVLGGAFNQACDVGSGIGVGTSNAVSSGNNSAALSMIGSGSGNVITGAASFIGSGVENAVNAAGATFIGGGYENEIVGGTFTNASAYGAIAGGENNTIQALGAYGGFDAFIGAGYNNTNEGQYGVIGGGAGNTVNASWATIGGGSTNQATGNYATVPGGNMNVASGTVSFAAGNNAVAANVGAFVWSDASGTQVSSTGPNQFVARATGGFTFYTNSGNSVGAMLSPGSGTWASLSDRTQKRDIAVIDTGRVLSEIAALPISEWSYISEPHVRHVGPMAQDFYAAFKVGEDNRHITSIDETGVALAAIKALNVKNARLEESVQTLQREVSALQSEVAAIRR